MAWARTQSQTFWVRAYSAGHHAESGDGGRRLGRVAHQAVNGEALTNGGGD